MRRVEALEIAEAAYHEWAKDRDPSSEQLFRVAHFAGHQVAGLIDARGRLLAIVVIDPLKNARVVYPEDPR